MKNTLLALSLVAACSACYAQPRALFTLAAVHADDVTQCEGEAPRELKGAIPGAAFAYDVTDSVMLGAGVWRTSQSNWAPFAVADWRPLRYRMVSAGLFAGVSGGYCIYENRLGPIGGATVRIDIDRVAVHLLYVPEFGAKKNTATAALAVSFGF